MPILLRYILLPILVGLVIFVGTCLAGPGSMPEMPRGISWDKLVHFLMFFFLSAVSLIDYYKLHKGSPSLQRWIFWGFLLPVLYGGVIELLQLYVFTSRSAELWDWIADILGSLAALIVVIIYLRKRDKKNK